MTDAGALEMKIIKPFSASVLHRTVEIEREPSLHIGVFAMFALDAPKRVLSEVELWKHAASVIPGGILDEGVAKPESEVLVAGACHPPNAPQAVSYVRVQLGAIDKRLAVFGDRHWVGGSPSAPLPFNTKPIDYAHAFGGPALAENPIGLGLEDVTRGGHPVRPLPNVEDPRALLTRPSDRPAPAGLLGFDMTWPQRAKRMGRAYGADWLEHRSPGPAVDFDPHFYCLAPDDQRIRGFFRGDEAYAIENMHPIHARIEGALPAVAARVFVTQKPPTANPGVADRFREVAMHLETVWFFPGALRGVLVFRGTVPVVEDDAADIVHLVVGLEDRTSPRSRAHYERVLRERLDPEEGAILSLADEDLTPSTSDGWQCEGIPIDPALARPGEHARANMRRRAERIRSEGRAEVESRGLDPADYGLGVDLPEEPAVPSPNHPREIARFAKEQRERAEAEQKKLEAQRAKAIEDARALSKQHGLAWEVDIEQLRKLGPPVLGVAAQMTSMREMLKIARDGGSPLTELEALAADPEYEARLVALEAQSLDGYRKSAQFLPDAQDIELDARAELRARFLEARAAGANFHDKDFSGADLSGLDLSGLDLSGAFLEGALLVDTDLSGARLDAAVLARCDLTDARLSRCSAVGANFGVATLSRTRLDRAVLKDAIFSRALLRETLLSGSTLDGAELIECKLDRPLFNRVRAKRLTFLRLTLTGIDFREAELTECLFLECDLAGADFRGARLSKARMITITGEGALFDGAALEGAFVGHNSALPEASFVGANLKGANLRGTRLGKANLSRAVFDGGDLSECDLRGASLEELRARKALLVRTDLRGATLRRADLLGAMMQKANLRGADLRGANLFSADLSRAWLDRGTQIEGALVEYARIEPRREPVDPKEPVQA